VQGWLELAFSDAPHVVVAGANEGLLPEHVPQDAFLPDALRRTHGKRHNGTRLARDAYLLEAIVRSRSAIGRVDVLCAKTSSVGDPRRPSTLLMRCYDEALPGRVRFLFQTPERREAHLAWQRAWLLRPRHVAPPKQIAVTALRRWLACRFRFYLKYALRMEGIDPAKSEMDAYDFGRLCHTALEAMGRDAAMRDCTDASVLREFLLAQLGTAAARKFGRELSLPLVIQLESARQRLSRLADIQARERAEGWAIVEVERPIAVQIGAMTVRGQVDRIDRHEGTGAVRVLDYKTSDSGVIPRVAHTRAWRQEDQLPDWAAVTIEGRKKAWADLQLPLYREALAPEFGADISLGYLTLPKAVGETALALWDDYTPELHASAMACAAGVCAAIERGEFWPPNEDVRAENDEFASLFHEGAAASVAWEERETI
jgi:ATP-dependent helicase/nuclease subunit B